MTSPDGKVVVNILDGGEFRMGGPFIGTIALSTGPRFDHCGESMIFSDDSRHLAVATWEQRETTDGVRLAQRILIIAVHAGASVQWPGEFDELAFRAFEGGILHAVDSPRGEAREFRISSRLP
jgi:hypothetical protein